MTSPTRLSSPGSIGPLRVRNRIVMAPLLLNLAREGGEVSDRLIAFYRDRARGGTGLILTEATYVVARGGVATRGLAIHDDRFLPGLARLVDAIKGEGGAAGLQLFFNGAGRGFASSDTVSVGPSDLSGIGGPAMHPLSLEEIARLRTAFVEAAGRAVRAGFDAVELHMVHGHLLGRFVSPHFNRRMDAYGGTVERRLRLPREIVADIKSRHPELALITRISVDERLDGGIRPPMAIEIANRLLAGGADAVHVSVGNGTTAEGLRGVFPSSYLPEIPYLPQHVQLLDAVDGTVLIAGGVRSLHSAETLLAGGADFVTIGRGLIADPELAAKWTAPGGAPLRPCVGTNQGCVDALVTQRSALCLVNPAVGREGRAASPEALAAGLRVAVVGGGPAGMSAALAAAADGHRVTLFERSPQLGGQLRDVLRMPGKAAFGAYLEWAVHTIEADGGIEVRVSTAVEGPDQTRGYDAVLRATGSHQEVSALASTFTTPAITGEDAIRSPVRPDGVLRVVVYGAGMVANSTALWLAVEWGVAVTLLSPPQAQVPDAVSTAYERQERFTEAGVRAMVIADVSEELAGTFLVTTSDVARATIADVDLLVDTSAIVATADVLECLVAVGDANAPGSALDAIRQGALAADGLSALARAASRPA